MKKVNDIKENKRREGRNEIMNTMEKIKRRKKNEGMKGLIPGRLN